MWVLNLLPDWIFHLITIAGLVALLAGFILKAIPFVSTYRLPLQVGGLFALLVGIWFEGGISNNNAWLARVKEMEEKVAAAEQQSKEATAVIDTKTVTKVQVIKERGETIYKYIESDVAKYDGTCVIPNEFIKAHNSAAEALK